MTQPVAHEPAGGLGWNLDPALMAGAIALAAAYAVRARRLERRGRGVPAWRQACFHAGVAVVVLALVSPIDTIGESRLFYVHMAQHLMIGDLGPLLILLGLSGPMLRPVLATPFIHRLRFLAGPLVALPLWVAVLYVWHLPGLYEAALDSSAVHAVEHACFFSAGLLMWAAVIEPLPGPVWFGNGLKAVYVLAVRTFSAVLATVFLWVGTPLYPGYRAGEHAAGISPITDQQIGGGIMLIEGAVVTLVVFAWLFLRWASEAELRQSLLESGADARVATRTARYGRRAPAPPRPSRLP